MGATSLARAALACAAFAILFPPWYGLEGGLAGWPGGDAAPLAVLVAQGRSWWLWPIPLALAAAAPALTGRGTNGRLLIACGVGVLAWAFLQGFAIGTPGQAWGIAETLAGVGVSQPAFGWGAALLIAGAVGLVAAGFAAQGAFGGDGFISALVLGSAALLVAFVFAPLLTILSAAAVEAGQISPGAMLARLGAREAWSLACVRGSLGCGVVWNTLALAVLTGILSTLLGLAFALLSARGAVRGGGAFRALAILPLITPPFVVSLSLIVLFGRTGVVTQFLSSVFDIPRSRWIYGLPGVLLAQLLAITPIAFMLLEGAVRQIAPSLEEAAATMGARRFTVFQTVTWPLLRPSLAAAFLLGFVESLSDFGNPLVLGGDFDVLATRIFFAIAGARHDPGRASALALLLLGLTLGAFALQTAWLGRRRYVTLTGKGDSGVAAPLPRGLAIACGAVAYPWLTFTAVVYAIIMLGAFVHDIGRGDMTFTWRHYITAFAVEWRNGPAFTGAAWDSLFSTVEVAAISAPLTAGLGILLAWLFARQTFPGRRTLEFMAMLSFAIPGTVVGVSYILAFNVPPVELTGTSLILVICFVFRNLPVGMRGGIAALAQIDRSLDEASATMGATAVSTLRRVILPLLRPAIVAALAYAFVQAMTAVSAVIFLVSARHNLATVYIVGRVEAGEITLAIAYCSVLIVIILAVVLGIDRAVGSVRIGRRAEVEAMRPAPLPVAA